MKKDTIVIGLGNLIMTDEGIGCTIVGHFSAHSDDWPGIEFIDGGTGGMNLLHMLAGRKKVVIIDCAKMSEEPGTMKRFAPDQVKSIKQLSHYSLHEVDILKVIQMAEQLGSSPEEVIIYGIEPEKIEFGRGLTETLSARLSGYIKQVTKDIC